jgi:hypothetical protein
MIDSKMQSIPAFAAQLCLSEEDFLALPGVLLGNNPEVDLEALTLTNPTLASDLEKYYRQARELWHDPRSSAETIKVQYALASAKQQDTKDGKVLLKQQLVDLAACPVTCIVNEILLKEPTSKELASTSSLSKTDDVYTMAFTGVAQIWPQSLGGPKRPGEVERTVKVSFSYAKWRDSKVKKLMKVEAQVTEMWPAPPRLFYKTGL